MSNKLQELVGKAYETHLDYSRADPDVQKSEENTNNQLIKCIQVLLIALGMVFAWLVIVYKYSWANNSPLFNVFGAAVCLLFLFFCKIMGGLWWFITNSNAFLVWAGKFMPVGIQPYRSASAIMTVFIVFALFFPQLLRSCNRLQCFIKYRQFFLSFLICLLIAITIGLLIVTIRLRMHCIQETLEDSRHPEIRQYDSAKVGASDYGVVGAYSESAVVQ